MEPLEIALTVAGGVLLLWAVLVAALVVVSRRHDDSTTFKAALRLLPDVLRLLRRLAADPTLPRGVRWRLGLTLAYLALPIDLVPDMIPVVGYADDVVVVALVLRSVVRAAGPEALDRHWPGTPPGLATLKRLL